jgi:drug/metabolite transporter (DMT)-like permease
MNAVPAWTALLAALAATALAQLTYKLTFSTGRRAWLLAAIPLFLGATGCTYLALKGLSIGMVYMSTAVTQLLVAGLARLVLKETLTRDHAVALTLIVLGVALYTR